MIENTERSLSKTLARWTPVVVLMTVILFHAINNWIWLSRNVVIRGWDRIGALVNSLYYHQTLSEFSLQALFAALTQDQIRPPLFGLSMSLMYKFFDPSPDVAVMVNVIYLVLLVAACYGLGHKLRDRRLGLLAAILVALIPLLFAMSRYSYFEFALAALTALGVYLLLETEGFGKKKFSVLLGIVLGLGMLVKRTFPIFVLGAITVVILQSGFFRHLWRSLHSRPRFRWRHLLLAIGGGLLLAALWYLPNRILALALPAGQWVFPLWWLLSACTIFALLQPSSVVSNLFVCGFLALSLVSVWYLPHADFVQRALRAGWGVNDPRGRAVDLLDPATYTNYLRSLTYGFSPVFVAVFLLAAGLVLGYAVRHRQRLLPKKWWTWRWWPVVVTIPLAYLILSTSIYHEHRAITPLLPLLGVVLAGLLLNLHWRWLRASLIVLLVTFGLVQFFAVSYTEARWLVDDTVWAQPILGQRSLFARGLYLETPDSEANDPAFWITDDVLRRVEATRQEEGWDTISLGVFANSSHVHAGMFAYDQITHFPQIEIQDLVQLYSDQPANDSALGYDYVVVLEGKNRSAAVREAEDLILNERPANFVQSFDLESVYPLPDGSRAHLFRRRSR